MSHKHNLRQHRFDFVIFLNANKHSSSSSKRRRDLQFSTGSITGWKLQFRSFACERIALFANIFFKRETSDRNRYVANDILSYWWAVSRCIIALVFCVIDAPKQLRADVNYDVERQVWCSFVCRGRLAATLHLMPTQQVLRTPSINLQPFFPSGVNYKWVMLQLFALLIDFCTQVFPNMLIW